MGDRLSFTDAMRGYETPLIVMLWADMLATFGLVMVLGPAAGCFWGVCVIATVARMDASLRSPNQRNPK